MIRCAQAWAVFPMGICHLSRIKKRDKQTGLSSSVFITKKVFSQLIFFQRLDIQTLHCNRLAKGYLLNFCPEVSTHWQQATGLWS